jgi:hypothetical protein
MKRAREENMRDQSSTLAAAVATPIGDERYPVELTAAEEASGRTWEGGEGEEGRGVREERRGRRGEERSGVGGRGSGAGEWSVWWESEDHWCVGLFVSALLRGS